jgi:tRNA-uridine 2-sulfurtransferase
MKKKVVVGMSGGVDSSVAAMLLKEQGYDVIGVTMQIWQDEEEAAKEANGGCCGLSAVDDARRVAQRLEIPYYVMNFKKEFKCHVMDYFVAEYLRGHTPNPCIACNRYVKWESLLQRSLEIGADYIATGHYARIDRLPNGRFAIRNSVTAAKDQTYALYNRGYGWQHGELFHQPGYVCGGFHYTVGGNDGNLLVSQRCAHAPDLSASVYGSGSG